MNKKALISITSIVTITIVIFLIVGGKSGVEIEGFDIKNGKMHEYIEVSGTNELDETKNIYSEINGIIDNIFVKEGEYVKVGQKLGEIDREDLDIEIRKAQASYSVAKAQVDDLKNAIEPEEIRQAESQVEQAIILMNNAKEKYEYDKDKLDKLEILKNEGYTSEQSIKDAKIMVTTSQSELNSSRKNLEIAKYNLELLKKGASQHSIEASEGNLSQVKAQLDGLKSKVQKAIINSESEGIVLNKYIEQGSGIQSGTLMFEVGNYNLSYIKANILTDDASKVKIGQKSIITGEAIGKGEVQGEVSYIAPKAEKSISSLGVEQQRIEVRIKYDNSSLKLRPGFGVDVKIITSEKEPTLFVPEESIFKIEGKDNLFVIKGNKLLLKEVKRGIENKEYIEIVEGIENNETIVKKPTNDLRDGMNVRALKNNRK